MDQEHHRIDEPGDDDALGAESAMGGAALEGATQPPGLLKASPSPTNAGRVWVALGFSILVLIALIIFIAQNTHDATINFLGLQGSISTGLALLIAAVAGAIVTLLAGSARILQLRREIRRGHRPRKRRD